MDIFFDSFSFRLAIILFILLFASLAWSRPRFAALLFPIILPFYLVKVRLDLDGITSYALPTMNYASHIVGYKLQVTSLPRALTRGYSLQVSSIPTNLLEILIIVFLLINYKLVFRGIKYLWLNTFVIPAYFCCHPRPDSPCQSLRRSAGRGSRKKRIKIGACFLFSVLLLLSSTVLSTATAINLHSALGAAKSWFFLPIFLFFALIPLLQSPRYRTKFLYSVAFSGILAAIMALPFILENVYAYDGRLTGIYLSPNHLAMALAPGILALIILLLNYKNPTYVVIPAKAGIQKKKTFGFGMLLVTSYELLVLFFTYSYGTWIGLLVASLVLIIPLLRGVPSLRGGVCKTKNKKLAAYSLAIIAVLVIIFATQLNNPKLYNILQGNYYSSLHSRIMIWQSALLISKDHWLAGIGAGNFQQAYLDYQKYFPEPYIEWAVPMPHNIFLAFMTQLGIIGLTSFVLIVFLSFARIFVIPAPTTAGVNSGGLPALYQTVLGLPARQGIQKSSLDPRVSAPINRSLPEDDKTKLLELKIVNCKLNENCKLKTENLNKLSGLNSLSLWALTYLIYIIVHGLIDTPYFKNDLAILFWFALAVIWNTKSPLERGARVKRGRGV